MGIGIKSVGYTPKVSEVVLLWLYQKERQDCTDPYAEHLRYEKITTYDVSTESRLL